MTAARPAGRAPRPPELCVNPICAAPLGDPEGVIEVRQGSKGGPWRLCGPGCLAQWIGLSLVRLRARDMAEVDR